MRKVGIRPGAWMAYEDDWFGPPWTTPETVVMVHGNSESSRAWTQWVPHLAGKYRVVRPDLPGFGASPEPSDYGWSAPELAADIARFLDVLAIDRCHLIGAKYGGSACMQFAADNSRRLRSLALFGSPFRGTGSGNADAIRAQRRAAMGRRNPARAARQRRVRRTDRVVDRGTHGQDQRPRRLQRVGGAHRHGSRRHAAAHRRSHVDRDDAGERVAVDRHRGALRGAPSRRRGDRASRATATMWPPRRRTSAHSTPCGSSKPFRKAVTSAAAPRRRWWRAEHEAPRSQAPPTRRGRARDRRRILRAGLAALAGLMPVGAAAEGAWPTHPVRIVVPFAPGGGADLIARMLAPRLQQELEQSFFVENRAGAAGRIGTAVVAKSDPDGHTLLMTTESSIVIAPHIGVAMAYDPLKDLAPVSLLTRNPVVLVVHPSLGANTLKDYIALARTRPGQLFYASSGAGGPNHLAGEIFKQMAGVDIVHVPYPGTGAAIPAVISNQVGAMWGFVAGLLPHIRSGTLKALAIGSRSVRPPCRTFRQWRKPACPATRRRPGSAFWRRPPPRSRSSANCGRRSAPA